MSLTLYYSPGACSLGSHIALEEAGASYQTQEVAVHRGETQSPQYLAINPRGRVPALAIGDTLLTENTAIMAYVAICYPEAALLPQDSLNQARCLEFMAWIASTMHPAFAHIVKPARFADDPAAHATLIDTGQHQYWAYVQEIDRQIGAGKWIMGERFTLCDACLLPFWGFARRLRLPMDEVAHFTAWKERMLDRPAVHRVLKRENSPLLIGRSI